MRVNADDYKDLGNFDIPNVTRNTFMPVFITGENRPGQEYGKLQIGDLSKQLFQNNLTKVYFIPLFIKQIWSKTITEKNDKKEDYDKLVDFSWDNKVKPKPINDPDCKYSYIVAGLFIDENTKKKVPHPYIEDKYAVIYFNCKGTKVGSILDFNKLLDTTINEYMSRSDYKALTADDKGSFDYDREKILCGYRRLICSADVAYADTNFGKKHIFKFSVIKEKTPDGKGERSKVLDSEDSKTILDLCKNIQKDFTKQFDRTPMINKNLSQPVVTTVSNIEFADNVNKNDSSIHATTKPVKNPEPKVTSPASSSDDAFDLDLSL
jgi:hypothetical protein